MFEVKSISDLRCLLSSWFIRILIYVSKAAKPAKPTKPPTNEALFCMPATPPTDEALLCIFKASRCPSFENCLHYTPIIGLVPKKNLKYFIYTLVTVKVTVTVNASGHKKFVADCDAIPPLQRFDFLVSGVCKNLIPRCMDINIQKKNLLISSLPKQEKTFSIDYRYCSKTSLLKMLALFL